MLVANVNHLKTGWHPFIISYTAIVADNGNLNIIKKKTTSKFAYEITMTLFTSQGRGFFLVQTGSCTRTSSPPAARETAG